MVTPLQDYKFFNKGWIKVLFRIFFDADFQMLAS